MKFHLQFAHTPSDKLIKLINSVGDQWVLDHVLKDKIKNRLPPGSTVGLPLANILKNMWLWT